MKEFSSEELSKVELRSEEINEILGKSPNWMIRWGITIISIVIAIILIGSWFFKYPEIVEGSIIATTQNPPSPLHAKISGKIEHLFVENNQIVNKGEPIAVIESSSDWQQVLNLIKTCDKISPAHFNDSIEKVSIPEYNSLGSIQPYHAILLTQLNDYKKFIKRNFYPQQIVSLKNEYAKYRNQRKYMFKDLELAKEEYNLIFAQFERDSLLFIENVIPQAEYDASKSTLINYKKSVQQAELNLSNADIRIAQLDRNIFELENSYKEQRDRFELNLKESFNKLQSSIQEWKLKYLIETPIAGVASFTYYWSKNQTISAGDRLVTIIPQDPGEIIGKIILFQDGAGKVKLNQQVNISFNNYPYLEFGMVRGYVQNISKIPEKEGYIAEVFFPDGLITFYGEELDFQNEMTGKAEIITEDIRLLEKIVRPLRYIINKNKR